MPKVKQFGVIGAGAMGSGIAQVAAQSGYPVVLFDISQSQWERARGGMEKSLARLAEKQLITDAPAKVLERISFVTDLKKLSGCDFVVEAATEDRKIKFELFRDLDGLLPKDAILCSNTSSISITEIAAQTKRPELVVGMHFMNPVPLMKLVEGIRGLATSDAAFQRVRAVSLDMGKTFVEAKDSAGFVVNRILMPMINEAFFALQEGLASAEDIDSAMKLGCNFPMGPLQLADFVGIDICLSVCEVLYKDLGNQKYAPAPLMRKYVEAGWLGKKVGKGVYAY